MTRAFTKEDILRSISAFRGFEKIEIAEEGVAYRLSLYQGNKSVVFTWPFELGEVFVDYLADGAAVYSDWFECLEADEIQEFTSSIQEVAKRYLHFETRIFKKGRIFKSAELQYRHNDEWLNVLHPA